MSRERITALFILDPLCDKLLYPADRDIHYTRDLSIEQAFTVIPCICLKF